MLPFMSMHMPSMPRSGAKSCSTFLRADAAVLLQRIGEQLPVALGVVVGQVERLHVRRQDDAVGLLHVGDDLRHRAVGVDAVDALGVDLARLVADVARVGEVDAALACRWSGRWGC